MIAELWKSFWQFKTSWNRVPGMLFAVGIILSFSTWLVSDKYVIAVLSIISLLLYIPNFVQLGIRTRRHNREWRWNKTEMFVSNMLIEHELRMAGDGKSADKFAEIREQLKKW